MGIYEDYLAYAGEGLYEADETDPMYARLAAGDIPRPIEDYYKDIGSTPARKPPRPVLDPIKILTTGESWTPEHTDRLGEIIGAHTKEVGRSTVLGALSTSQFLNRMKEKFIPYYNESTAVRSIANAITKFGPGVMALDRDQELAMSMMAESEYLKADPRALETHNWFEGLVSVGPQIGSMYLASMVGGPWAGFGMIGMQILGGTYDSLIQQGTPPEEAYLWSLGNAVTQGALEMVPFLRAMKKFKFRMPMLEKLKVIGEVAGTEFLTEWAQAYPDSFVNIFATNPDKDLWERTEMFVDQLGETTRQGMYEGTLTAPWSLLTAPFGAIAGKIHRDRDAKDESKYYWRRLEEESARRAAAAEGGEFVPLTPEEISGRRAPTRASSSVTQAHLDMMSPEQRQRYDDMAFDQQFAERRAAMPQTQAEQEQRRRQAFNAANAFAETKRVLGDDMYVRQPNLDLINRRRVQDGLNLIATQDLYEGTPRQIGVIKGEKGLPDRPIFETEGQIPLTEEEYGRREKLLGSISDLYYVDRSQIPPDLRGSYALMAEQVGSAEPKGATFVDATGQADLAEGMPVGYGSSYPDWFKAPFTIKYVDAKIKRGKDGRPIKEEMKDSEGKPVLYTKGKRKGQPKMISVREMKDITEEFEFGLNRDDFFRTIDMLENGKMFTMRQHAIADHIMGVAQAIKASDPELAMQGDIDQMEADGYEIIGNTMPLGNLELGDQVVVENRGGEWNNYTVVSEDDGAGNMVLDSFADRIQGPPDDTINVVGRKANNYWQTMYDVGGPQAVADAPKTLPGVTDIDPLHILDNVYSMAQMEQDYADNLPELAEFFENPEGIRQVKQDRRQTIEPVEQDRRTGTDRRTNWQLTDDIDSLTPAEKDEALEFARKAAVEDVLTGLLNRNALEMHKKEFGADVPFVAIDVDGLKYYNDMTQAGMLPTGEWVEGGHALGDQVLALMGRAMTEAADITGVMDRVKLYRHGGDEYGISGVDRDSVSEGDLEILRNAVRDTASQIMLDFLGTDDNIHYQLNGLAFTSSTGGTIQNAISAAETIKDNLPAEYATVIKEGKKKPTRARIPGTRVEVNYLPVGWDQSGEGLLASQARETEEVARSFSQAEPATIDERVVGVHLAGPEFQWSPDDTIEDAIAWTLANIRRLAQDPNLPEANAWDFILSELTYEAEDIGMPPSMLANGLNAGALELAQEYLTAEQLGVPVEAAPEIAPAAAPAVAAPAKAVPVLKPSPAPALIKKKVPPVTKPARPKLPAPPPKLVAPEVIAAEILPMPEQAPTVKSRKAKFVRENIEFMPLGELVTVRYMDPTTGEMVEIEEPAREAFTDLEENVNEFYQLMECLKT